LRSDRIQQLVKKWLESGEDRIPEELGNLLQCPVNPEWLQVFSRRIVERYKDGSLSLHFHISESLPDSRKLGMVQGKADATEYCAVAEFFVAEEHGKKRGITPAPINGGIVCDSGSQIQHLVLVEFVEIGHSPERIIPTRVRLQTIDECLSLVGHPIQPMTPLLIGESFRRGANREHVLDTVLATGSRIFDKLPDQMIEGRSRIEEKITDHGTEIVWRIGKLHPQKTDILLRVLLGNETAVAVGAPVEQFDYRFKVLLCPDQFSLE
jgi:hypothetical protein